MAEYVVTADGHTAFEFNERGDLVGKTRYKRGDTIELDEDKAAPLVAQGGLRAAGDESEELSPEAVAMLTAHAAAAAPPDGSGVTGGAGEVFPDSAVDEDALAKANASESDESTEEGDEYDAMDYAELQAEAKEREDIPANQSAEALREALRADDAK